MPTIGQKQETDKWFLYYLFCPKLKIPRYVGITINPKERYNRHIKDNTKTHKTNWIKELKLNNLLPIMKIISSNLSKNEARKLEIKHGNALYKIYGNKITNIHEALGGTPPIYFGKQNKSAKRRPFKIWNDNGEEYLFDYQFEVKDKLGYKLYRSLYKVLNGTRKSINGYYACYIDQIHNWKPPKNYLGANSHFAKRRPFKIWNDSGEEYFFDYQFEAIKKLGLSQKKLSSALSNKQKTIQGFYVCYIENLSIWIKPKDNRYGSRSNLSKKRPFILYKIDKKEKSYFNYQFEAVKKFNLTDASLSNLLKGKLKSHKGYKGYYID